MNEIRKAAQRGHANHGWLDSFHTFSFASYHDPEQMGWGPLRVINDDTVAPGRGFGAHSHRDMEIISYVLDGALEHKDSMGTGSVLRPGAVQLMSAGSGVTHSEFNHSKSAAVHFLQIWIEPSQLGAAPNYQERIFEETAKRGVLRLVVSPDGRDGSLTVRQDANVYAALLDGAESIEHQVAAGRRGYLHLARGALSCNGERLQGGDGIKLDGATTLRLSDGAQAELLFFDLG